ncbi:MAG: tRNA isopentenyl-2-thiomethyl-A-37 hydroxylase MiaE [Deltaproteobacteria bacterium]
MQTLGLRRETDPAWVELALGQVDRLLQDHAHCEKKAAATALSLVSTHPDRPSLVAELSRLAQEEMRHLFLVLAELERRGIPLGRCPSDPYARRLMALIRPAGEDRLCDRLLVGSVIEARSCERFSLLERHCTDPRLRKMYGVLFAAEAEHHSLFSRLAAEVVGAAAARARMMELLDHEAKLIVELPLRAAVH